MPAHYQLRCLGEPGLFTLGGRPIKLRTRKQLALLCYLAMEPRRTRATPLLTCCGPRRRRARLAIPSPPRCPGCAASSARKLFECTADRIRLRPGVDGARRRPPAQGRGTRHRVRGTARRRRVPAVVRSARCRCRSRTGATASMPGSSPTCATPSSSSSITAAAPATSARSRRLPSGSSGSTR